MSAMMVKGAAVLRDVVEVVCRKGGEYRRGHRDHHTGEYLMFLELNGRIATVFTDDLDRVVGPTIVDAIEKSLETKLTG